MKAIQCGLVFLLSISLLKLNAQDLKIITATSQRWTAGVKGGGGGVRYSIVALAGQSSERLKVDKLWVDNRLLPAEAFPKSSSKYGTKSFLKGDTIEIRASLYKAGELRIPDNERKIAAEPDTNLVKPAIAFKGEGLVYFKNGKKRKYLRVERFQSQPHLSYP